MTAKKRDLRQNIRTVNHVPDGTKKVLNERVLIPESQEYGISDFEYMLVQKVLKDPLMNATRAYLELRPSTTQQTAANKASAIMNSDAVSKYFTYCVKERLKIGVVSEEEILYNLKMVALRCMQAEPVLNKDGKPTGEFKFEANSAIRALELLGKNLGMFKEKIEHVGPNGGPVEVVHKDMTMADAVQIYKVNLKGVVDNGSNN